MQALDVQLDLKKRNKWGKSKFRVLTLTHLPLVTPHYNNISKGVTVVALVYWFGFERWERKQIEWLRYELQALDVEDEDSLD